ncbi:alpha/beta hydrolase [Melampsora larici-populina 98AG31]|uniref:Alpha/beta hydrolase n=1 Tax=Melampsora larici-populina (strain 98AG31 / pathotype 3-4-7) TaxID=747676 RepID=F4RSJ1_MELLP|nr:alpha/beta hydrolase [Melampsora larici-populina 98AG31]EGG04611.1 alpha/beta hydrolase [Melampsora larici-populina 98AG31]
MYTSQDQIHLYAQESADDLPTALDPKTCLRRGFCPVPNPTRDPHQAYERKIYFELHGSENPTHKMVFIMGLNNTCFSWSRQVEHFSKKPGHAVLVFDNRGVGYSSPGRLELYKTSEMAKDILELLNYIHWTQDRSLHIIGVSMGGMITQELCFLIPNRVISVTLTSTKARDIHLPPLKVMLKIALMNLTGANQAQRVSGLVKIMFPDHYLEAPAKTSDDQFTTNQILEEAKMGYHHDIMRPQSSSAEVCQTAAALFHSCSSESLNRLRKSLGNAKVMILTGDEDLLMSVSKSVELHQDLKDSELIVWKGGGHALCAQMEQEYNSLIERVMKDGHDSIFNSTHS